MKYFIIIILIFLSACKANKTASLEDAEKTKGVDIEEQLIKKQPLENKNEVVAKIEQAFIMLAPAPEPENVGQGYSYIAQSGNLFKSKNIANLTLVDSSKEVKENVGLIAYSVPEEMAVGKNYSVKIRISKEDVKDVLINGNNDISINDKKIKSVVTIDNVRVSNIMSAALTGTDDDFKIESLSTETQDIEDQGYTEWEWNVKPLKSGKNVLKLLVKVKLEKEESVFKDIVVFEKNISIKTNFAYSIKTFFSSNWQFFLTTFIIPFVIWWYNKKKKKKK